MDRSLNRMNRLQEQLSDGKRIHRPSDDPLATIRSLRFNSNLVSNEQFNQNVKDGISWMETTDGALSDLGSILIQAKETVVKAIAPNPEIAFQTLGTEIDGLINHVINLANTQIGDRYIFAGQKDKMNPPLQPVTIDANGNVVYNGDNGKVSMPIQQGPVDPAHDSVNVTTLEAFGVNLELINHLTDIKKQLMSGTPDLQYLSNTALANIDSDHDRVLLAQTKLGARMSMYELADNFLQDNNVTINTYIADNEDLDIAKALTDFKTNENVYQAALSIGSKIMPVSLVDFLK
jgi:flagellar hook-associated protein 3 FlgL